MAIFVIVLLLTLALFLVFGFFGLWVGLPVFGMMFLALIIFVIIRGKRHPGDVTLNDPYMTSLSPGGVRSIGGRGPSIEEQKQEISKLSE